MGKFKNFPFYFFIILCYNIKKDKGSEYMSSVEHKVVLLNNPKDMIKNVAIAGKLCYSPLTSVEEISNSITDEEVDKFIRMLIKMHHFSPIEHVYFTFGIEGFSRATLAQLTRHRLTSPSVKSQRYVSHENFNYIVPPRIIEAGLKEKFDKQMQTISEWYKDWIKILGDDERGREDARFILPQATETIEIISLNARELIHIIQERTCNRAQWEIREIVWNMWKLAYKECPALFSQCGPACLSTGKCFQGKMECGKANEIKGRFEKEILGKETN